MRQEEADLRRQLEDCERHISRVTDLLHRLEGDRDRLILALSDLEGVHDQRFAGVR